MNAYMVYAFTADEAAILVFAHTAREARKVGRPTINQFDHFASYVDIHVSKLNKSHLFAEADPIKLAGGIAHVIESPNTCPNCETWGGALAGDGCEFCSDETI
jgi:hypothetical protein